MKKTGYEQEKRAFRKWYRSEVNSEENIAAAAIVDGTTIHWMFAGPFYAGYHSRDGEIAALKKEIAIRTEYNHLVRDELEKALDEIAALKVEVENVRKNAEYWYNERNSIIKKYQATIERKDSLIIQALETDARDGFSMHPRAVSLLVKAKRDK
jgi:hypothetical protein